MIEIADQFKDDARQVSDEDQDDENDALAFDCLAANRFGNGKRPAAAKADQHDHFKNMGV